MVQDLTIQNIIWATGLRIIKKKSERKTERKLKALITTIRKS